MNPALLNALQLFCAISFMGYGLSCLVSNRMITEFTRYGIPQFRVTTGWLQLLAATGLLLGFKVEWLGMIAAAGLCLQMLCGLCLRIYIKDAWYLCLPAGLYAVIAAVVAVGIG